MKTRWFLVAVLAVTAANTRRVAFALSINSIRTHLPDIASVPTTTADVRLHTIHPAVNEKCNKNHNISEWNGASVLNRKQALRSISSVFAAGVLASTISPSPSNAFDRNFPDELTDADNDDKPMGVLIGKRSNVQQRKQKAVESKKQMDQSLANFTPKKDLLSSMTWGLALFFATGSRSNPLATPLANALYDETEEKWLQDRNAGLFSALPLEFLGLLGVMFLIMGTVTQYSLLQLSGGDSTVCGQLAGVALINAGFFEIGRIASGEKGITRDENDRAVQLKEEFEEFAEKRLKPGGNCHRSDIVKSFRRYFAKYRQADSEQYPLTDLEIEKLLRSWNKQRNQGKAEMSSSGFYYGIQINANADVFA